MAIYLCWLATPTTPGVYPCLSSSSAGWTPFIPCKQPLSYSFPTSKGKKRDGGISLDHSSTAYNRYSVKNGFEQPEDKAAIRKASREIANTKRASRRTMSAILRMEAAKDGIERKAATKKAKYLFPKTVLETLTDRIHNKQWQSAVKVFGLLREQQWYQPNIEIYTQLLVMLGKCRQHEQAYVHFQMMREEGCDPTAEVYTALVAAYSRSGLFEKAFAVLDEMKAIPHCHPNIFTYTIFIKSCTEASHFDHVDRLLFEMSRTGIKPNIVTYNTIVDGYGKAGLFEEMGNAISHMVETGCMPDVWTMNSVVGAFGNRGQIEMMEQWYGKFQCIGIHPDVRTFNTMISSYGKQGLYDKMIAVMDNMQKNFFSWTTVTYNTVIDAFGRVGDIDKMEYFYNLMKSEGVKPNSITCCSLVNAYSKAGIFHKIAKIVRHMENSNVGPDTPFFNSVINAYQRAGDLAEMERTFAQMKDRGCNPDKITFTTMIKAYLSQGMAEKAQELEHTMWNIDQISR